jgi:hypothetical protein
MVLLVRRTTLKAAIRERAGIVLNLVSRQALAISLATTMVSIPLYAEETAVSSQKPQVVQTQEVTVTPGHAPEITQEAFYNLIEFYQTLIPMKSKLGKEYQGSKVVMVSHYPGTLRITNANLMNSVPGSTAYQAVKKSTTPVFFTFFMGLAGFVVIGLPWLAVVRTSNKKSRTDSRPFSGNFPSGTLAKEASLTFNVLTPSGQNPQMNFSFVDVTTGKTYTISKF